jgi:hypothetical protein
MLRAALSLSRYILSLERSEFPSAYVFALMRSYAAHKGIDHLRTRYFCVRLLILGWVRMSSDRLEKILISDDLLIRRVAGNEAARNLLGSAVVSSRKKHPFHLPGQDFKAGLRTTSSDRALSDFL